MEAGGLRGAARRLAIFDIDGTLTATNSVDDECYLRAVSGSLDLDTADVDWSDAPHITDIGITRWLWNRARGCVPEDREIADLQQRFVGLLHAQLVSAPERFAPIDGATTLFQRLRSQGWDIALATGAWGASAAMKLRAAGLVTHDIPLACADDAESREDIVRLARDKAERESGVRFHRVVSVGDAPWDVRTARSLGLPFVGIGAGARADRLRAAGATTILPHYAHWPTVENAFHSAAVPGDAP